MQPKPRFIPPELRRGKAVREFGERPLRLGLDSGKRLGGSCKKPEATTFERAD